MAFIPYTHNLNVYFIQRKNSVSWSLGKLIVHKASPKGDRRFRLYTNRDHDTCVYNRKLLSVSALVIVGVSMTLEFIHTCRTYECQQMFQTNGMKISSVVSFLHHPNTPLAMTLAEDITPDNLMQRIFKMKTMTEWSPLS